MLNTACSQTLATASDSFGLGSDFRECNGSGRPRKVRAVALGGQKESTMFDDENDPKAKARQQVADYVAPLDFEEYERERRKRDKHGRWLPGFCGNINGRPRNKPRLSEADLFVFGNTLTTVKVSGESVEMTQREANLKKLYESAMKGSVRAQIHLEKDFQRLDQERAEGHALLDSLERKYLIEGKGERIPREIEIQMMALRRILGRDEATAIEIARAKRRRKKPKS